jgi:hypothetical protein
MLEVERDPARFAPSEPIARPYLTISAGDAAFLGLGWRASGCFQSQSLTVWRDILYISRAIS